MDKQIKEIADKFNIPSEKLEFVEGIKIDKQQLNRASTIYELVFSGTRRICEDRN